MMRDREEELEAVGEFLRETLNGRPETEFARSAAACGWRWLNYVCLAVEDFLIDPSFQARPYLEEHAGRRFGDELEARRWLRRLSQTLRDYGDAAVSTQELFSSRLPPILKELADNVAFDSPEPYRLTDDERAALTQALADPTFDARIFMALCNRACESTEEARQHLQKLAQ